jgi:hypothetical protein
MPGPGGPIAHVGCAGRGVLAGSVTCLSRDVQQGLPNSWRTWPSVHVLMLTAWLTEPGWPLLPAATVRTMPPEPLHQDQETRVAALRSFETVDALGSKRNELAGRHALLRRARSRCSGGSGCASSELRHRARRGEARRATGTQLGGERRHIQAEDGEDEVAIGGRVSDPSGPGRCGWRHRWSVSGGVGVVTRESAPSAPPVRHAGVVGRPRR